MEFGKFCLFVIGRTIVCVQVREPMNYKNSYAN